MRMYLDILPYIGQKEFFFKQTKGLLYPKMAQKSHSCVSLTMSFLYVPLGIQIFPSLNKLPLAT